MAPRSGATDPPPTPRLLSIAAGGQVLCSQAAVDLGRDDLPGSVTLLDLGEHELVDLARAERVFQVVHRDLPSTFPPLRSARARRNNLPVALTLFVGREQELEDLVHLLGSARLLTLTGVGGAGKTRLAIEAAARVTENFPDGVWLAELGPLRDPSLLVSEVLAAVGLEAGGLVGPHVALDEHLCDQLRTRHLLLLLDNCEHLVEAVARLVHTVLARCPTVTVIATSREVLGLSGEVVWGVPPLSLPPAEPAGVEDLAASDAVALFCERAQAARAGFGLSSTNADAVAQICRRLDGIPLALELAAARIRALGAHQLAARLDDRFRLLTGGARSAVPRHQTLRAAMDWSYQLLPPGEQVALRRLSVFPDSFDLESAEAVAGTPPGETAEPGFEVLDLLSRLIDKSLVTVQSESGDVRYRLLETVRQYAGEKLAEAAETASTHQRHRDFFLERARQGTGLHWRETGRWAHRISLEHASFRAALEWSLDEGDEEAGLHLAAALWLDWLWAARREGSEWLERALAGPARLAIPDRVEALIGLASLIRVSGAGELSRSHELLQEALALAIRLDDDNAAARARFFLGELALTRGDIAEARELLDAALARYEEVGALAGACWCHHELGWAAMAEGDEGRARTHFERGLELGPDSDNVLTPHTLAALAPLLAAAGEGERAACLAEEAVRAARGFSPRGILVMALTRATETALLSGAAYRAETWMKELLTVLRELGARVWVADALEMAALVRHASGNEEHTARVLGACEVLREAFGEPVGGVRLLSEKVRACRDRVAEVLGADGFAQQQALGRKMSVVEAISYALAELESP